MGLIAIIGAGPTGLMAAEKLATAGHSVTIYDHMSSVGRKFLMAGRGGLNLTHSEPLDSFLTRYGAAASWLEPSIRHFPPEALRQWSEGLGEPTFVGSSGRVFPKSLKASPLLRAWLGRLDKLGVRFVLKRRWVGWDEYNNLIFNAPNKVRETVKAKACLLALGGASWPRLGSDGGWAQILTQHGIAVAQLAPANCGFVVPWSDIFRERFEGHPLKPITLTFAGEIIQGEAVITAHGIEGGAIYALSGKLRNAIHATGSAILDIDLRPGLARNELIARLENPRGSKTLSNHLRKFGGLSPEAIGLLYETTDKQILQNADAPTLAKLIKSCPLRLTATTTIDRAISSAGGITRDAVDEHFMLRKKPGVFVAGEMLDWEAPTGGYLLQASFSTGVAAAEGMKLWMKSRDTV